MNKLLLIFSLAFSCFASADELYKWQELCVPSEQVTQKFMDVDLTDSNRAKVTIDAEQVALEVNDYKTSGVGTFGSEIFHPLILTIQKQSQYIKEAYSHLVNFSHGKGRFQINKLVTEQHDSFVKTFEQFPNGALNNDFWWVTKVKAGSKVLVDKASNWFFGSCFLANKTCNRLVYTNKYAVEFSYHFDNSGVVTDIERFIQNKINNWETSCKSA